MSDRAPEYWGRPDDELLTCTDLKAAVEDFIDSLHGHPVPTTVTMYGYAPHVLDEIDIQRIKDYALEITLERLDDNYGPTDEISDPTPAMKAAAEAFALVVAAEYRVFQLEYVTEPEVIDCKAWVSEHRPEWLDGIEWEDS